MGKILKLVTRNHRTWADVAVALSHGLGMILTLTQVWQSAWDTLALH
ncbi:hypothetical protein Tco_0503436, partial [Tanacetum coccineum]